MSKRKVVVYGTFTHALLFVVFGSAEPIVVTVAQFLPIAPLGAAIMTIEPVNPGPNCPSVQVTVRPLLRQLADALVTLEMVYFFGSLSLTVKPPAVLALKFLRVSVYLCLTALTSLTFFVMLTSTD